MIGIAKKGGDVRWNSLHAEFFSLKWVARGKDSVMLTSFLCNGAKDDVAFFYFFPVWSPGVLFFDVSELIHVISLIAKNLSKYIHM